MAFTLPPVDRGSARWDVVIDDGTVRPADRVIITTPLAQAFGLLADADLELHVDDFRVDYDRTICLLAVLDRPVVVSSVGGVAARRRGVQLHRRQHVEGRQRRAGRDVSCQSDLERAALGRPGATCSAPALSDAAQPWLGDAAVVDTR